MNTESDKVRYIYIKYIRKAIRKGFRFKETEIPNEINALLNHMDLLSNEQLFALYNRARYSKQSVITSEDVQNLLSSVGYIHHKA